MAKSYRREIHGKSPYFDDFDANKKFLRIMSRPGYPLQAREVTQLQTILQSQIERLGSHLFEEGANVNGGEIVEATAIAVRLVNTNFTVDQLKLFIGKTITNQNDVRASIIAYADSSTLSDDNNQVLFVNYTSSGEFSAGDTISILGTLPVITAVIGSSDGVPAVTVATNVVKINQGIFYADGFLIESNSESFVAYDVIDDSYRSFDSPTASIGFRINRQIVTSDDDNTLRDPSFGFYNFNSPGADRYKITLDLTQINLQSGDEPVDSEDFFEIIRIVDGKTTQKVRYTEYAIVEDTLARRTFDESGNYTVRPFTVTPIEYSEAYTDTSDREHAIKISSGKAYVRGYEFETITPTYFKVNRSLSTQYQYNQLLRTPLKNYVNLVRTSAFDDVSDGLRDTFTTNKRCFVQREDSDGVIVTIGTCNIRTIEEVAGEIRLYLFNINITSDTYNFVDSTHIAVDDGNSSDNVRRFRIGTDTTETAIQNIGPARQIFKAPVGSGLIRGHNANTGLQSSFLVKYPYKVEFSGHSIIVTSPHEFLGGTKRNYSLFYTSGGSTGATLLNFETDYTLNVNNSGGTKLLTISLNTDTIPPDGKGTLIASQQWSSETTDAFNNIRSKSLIQATTSGVTASFNDGIFYLNHADVYNIISITDATEDVTDKFDLDVNSGIDAYRRSRIILKAGASVSTDDDGNYVLDAITYNYFRHTGNGPFTVDSYPRNNSFGYSDIPIFTDPETGESYSLADAYDFRPVTIDQEETGYNNGSDGPQVVAFDNDITTSTVSYEHYLSRIDKVILTKNREFKLIQGTPAVTPRSPTVNQDDMVLGELVYKPYTRSPDDIKFKYIDNQRTTMYEMNEQEKTIQNDAFFSFRSDLEQKALNTAQNFRSTSNALVEGVFVDTFIGHNNSVTSKRDHNCSIDTEYGQLRPAFVSAFFPLSAGTGDALPGGITLTNDGIYMLQYEGVTFDTNRLASTTLLANQFAVPDYLGTLKITPSSDPYYTTSVKPKVVVNTIGETDNWEQNISAYQLGRTRGFGSQWRDWETLWFGSVKKNDRVIEHDSNGVNYTVPRRSSYVSKILSDKVIRKIGNKLVDLSVIPYTRSKTISFVAKNLKPNTNHYLRFDGVRVGGVFTTDLNGGVTGAITINAGDYLTGEKLVRLSDSESSNIQASTSSADAIFFALGLLDTEEGDISSVRPPITRRKSSNTEDVSVDRFSANEQSTTSTVFNSQSPLAQEISIDSGLYPSGVMLNSVRLFFADVDTQTPLPVKVHIRPIYNGSPDPYKVLPFSEVTLNADQLVKSDADGLVGTDFVFSTPVYLKPKTKYAICVTTNAPAHRLWVAENKAYAVSGEYGQTTTTTTTIDKPANFGSLHIPVNNGAAYSISSQFLKMSLQRCSFGAGENDVTFTTDTSIKKNYQVGYVHSNEQLIEDTRPTVLLKTKTRNGDTFQTKNISGSLNSTIEFDSQMTIDDNDNEKSVQMTTTFNFDPQGAVSTMIDSERISLVAVEYMANNDDAAAEVEEVNPTARLASNQSRYIGRKVVLSEEADDIVVILDGSFVGNAQAKVYVKLQGPDQPNAIFDDNPWTQLYPEGLRSDDLNTSEIFSQVKPTTLIGGTVRFSTDNVDPGTPGSYTAYQIKIVLMGEDTINSTGNAYQVPIIESVSVVPLRRITQDQVRRVIPVGSVLAYASEEIPSGFVLCNGVEYNKAENPEYEPLFQVIGYTYGGAGDVFRVPDLRQKAVVGRRGGPGSSTSPAASLGVTFGVDRFRLVDSQTPLAPHWHGYGIRSNQGSGNNDAGFVVNSGAPGAGWLTNGVNNYYIYGLAGDGGGPSPAQNIDSGTYPADSRNGAYAAMVTTWPIRPDPVTESAAVQNHGGGYGNSHIGRRQRNSNGVYTGSDLPLDYVYPHQPSITLNYIIKI